MNRIVIQWVDHTRGPFLGSDTVHGGLSLSYPVDRESGELSRVRGVYELYDPDYIYDATMSEALAHEDRIINVLVDCNEDILLVLQGFPFTGVYISGKRWDGRDVVLDRGLHRVEILVKRQNGNEDDNPERSILPE